MSRCFAFVAVFFAASLTVAHAQAQKPEEMGTPEQRDACGRDVGRFCKHVKPEEGPFAYLACLQKNSAKLHPACLKVIGGAPPQ
jgi:hypothetical protein